MTRSDVTVVTGAAGGIGRALGVQLRGNGSVVAGLDLVEPVECDLGIRCDVTSEDEVSEAIARIEEDLGRISRVVCAAGAVSEAPVEELPLEEWNRIVRVSLTGTFLVARGSIPHLKRAGNDGRIVTFSSGYATKGYLGGAHYAAAKAGVEALTKSLALELAPHGVTANCVAPGPVDTEMLARVAPGERLARTESAIPLGRVATPAEVVGVVSFLLSPAAAYITGQVIHVNGGMLMP